MFIQFINKIYFSVASVSFDTLIWILWGSFAAVFILTFVLCFAFPRFRSFSKRPYLCLVNAYTAVTLFAFLTETDLSRAVLAAVVFWFVGYLTYGLLCLITRPLTQRDTISTVSQVALTSFPSQPPTTPVRTDVHAAKSSVRLEHAISVTDKLLQKNLGKTDRQELEKLKNTLAVLQMKGTLSPAESDILNDNFNALLKLMAKYNI